MARHGWRGAARGARCAVALGFAAALLGAGAGASVAEAVTTIGVQVYDEPVVGAQTRIGAVGNIDGAGLVAVKVKPSGVPCAAASSLDLTSSPVLSQAVPAGPFNVTATFAFGAVGSYLLCGWAEPTLPNIVTGTSSVVTVRPAPLLTVSAPATVSAGQPFQVATTTKAEATHYLYLSARNDTGSGCPATAAGGQTQPALNIITAVAVTGGPATDTRTTTLPAAGRYLLCAYLQDSNPAAPPRAAFTGAVTIPGSASPPAAPPPGAPGTCVVPAVVKNELLTPARARLLAASCTPGAVRFLPSARFIRGSVFGFAPASGARLPAGAAVVLYVSTGRRCVVPKIPKSRSLITVKRRLKAANCTVGKVVRLRSRTRKLGRVIGLSPGVGKRLAPRAKVRIIVSSGKPR